MAFAREFFDLQYTFAESVRDLSGEPLPAGYVASARPLRGAFRSMPPWGQFVDRRGELRRPRAEAFLGALGRATSLAHVAACFPFQALHTTAPAHRFLASYGV